MAQNRINRTQKFFNQLNLKKIQYQKAFSVAEAMVALLIGSVALRAAAPMITKQIKHNNLNNAQSQIIMGQINQSNNHINQTFQSINELQEEINELRNKIEESSIPAKTIAFFNRTTCPSGWVAVADKNGNALKGFYPRIASEKDEDIGSTKEQMVHKHKHVSSQIEENNGYLSGNHRHNPSSIKSHIGRSVGTYRGVAYTGSLTYTGDGMNAIDLGILTCPNRDEGNTICSASVSPNMPLVGDENRPNSIVWLACEKK